MAKEKKPNSKVEFEREDNNTRDDLANSIAEELNKNSKDGGKVAFFLDQEDDPTLISDWISTGNSLLDLAISNRPDGGLPVGRIVEFNGLEGCLVEDTLIEVKIE